ncbi:DUF3618 domain-containing protein [Nocardioides sp. SLBN-35]|jgi:hypothetical protein|uniref:DUF3618 domain-containing protein n=1 Tax=Nocardioides sp. SLBN-35 TaxID=2768445 RepID=UPI0011536E30|nr:DUF3618 domain-containing protein [Nocardioides sp. SLBN-35]TQK72383.1 uncharacterized protein DUF3618 [Nocardioides sp. SLBN-35]
MSGHRAAADGAGVEELERTIEHTRAELAGDVDVLVARLARRSRGVAIGVAAVVSLAAAAVVLRRRGGRR